jgi:hypothetical protein
MSLDQKNNSINMSVDQTNKIDAIGVRQETNTVVLAISDHLSWEDVDFHLRILQEKLNSYLAFYESGEIFDSYPIAFGKSILIEVIGKYPLNEDGTAFFEEASAILHDIGIELKFKLLDLDA